MFKQYSWFSITIVFISDFFNAIIRPIAGKTYHFLPKKYLFPAAMSRLLLFVPMLFMVEGWKPDVTYSNAFVLIFVIVSSISMGWFSLAAFVYGTDQDVSHCRVIFLE